MGRKYLEELNIKDEFPWEWNKNDDRQKYWEEQRKEYGFDERDTWSLDYTMDLLLYERLCMYKEYVTGFIDLTFHKFTLKDEELTLGECLDRMIEGLRLNLTLDDYDEKRKEESTAKLISEVYDIYALCHRALWW